jgi:valyl-tRNA synthetase
MAEFTLEKTYDFRSTEERIYAWWEESGYFRPRVDPDQKPYVIAIPPPNVTGELHLGHAMFVAVEDMMIRHSRMQGRPTLWVPGSDHAGIATQLQVERDLIRQGTSREEIGREEFVRRTWVWKDKYGGIITRQLRRIGASCDWERERFTLDDGLSIAVREAFVRLYEKGLIYRGTYLINWSPGLRTAVSDLEVEYAEEEGTLYYFKYPIADSDEYIPVATTRPETILGDTAVAVHPEDERYRHLIGKTCLVPILKRTIPVIHDTYVDREFGTGALKITPGHDPADYEIGQRHGLQIINVLNPDATMNANAGPYAGLDRFDCREKLWSDMEREGLSLRTEAYTLQVPRTQRGGEIVEPLVSTQWFVKMEPLAKAALESVRSGRITIVPERFEKVYYNWLEGIRDWCISRQLWWGHRIPAWHCLECEEVTVARDDPDRCANCGSPHIEQDPDVLDTWFSSGLWPFSTLGWPEETEDYRYFYPTTMMETGYDILFFWVARMIMMGIEFTGREPFEVVYLHGLVRDEIGRKMSKTLGNVIDPLQVMDDLGADALRFTLLTGSTPGQDMKLSLERVQANRNFANKIWNAGRFIIGAVEKTREPDTGAPGKTLADSWIVARLDQVNRDVDRLFDAHQYGEAGRQIYEFFWGEFADWYIEVAKLQMEEGDERSWSTVRLLVHVFDSCLRMLHPFIPFVTEELWGHLKAVCEATNPGLEPGGGWAEALIISRWPEAEAASTAEGDAVRDFGKIQEMIKAIRNARLERGVDPKRKISVLIQAGEEGEFIEGQKSVISSLAGIDPEGFTIAREMESSPGDAIPLVIGSVTVYLPLEGLFDLGQEKKRLEDQLTEVRSQIQRLDALLDSPFSSKAPPQVVRQERDKLDDLHQKAAMIEIQLDQLSRA